MRLWPRLARSVVIAAGLASGANFAALATEPADSRLESVERALEEEREHERASRELAARVAREIEDLRVELIAAAAAAQAREQAVIELEQRLEALALEETGKRADLERRRGELVHIFAALEMLGRRPLEALIALPTSLTETSRASLLLGFVTRRLDEEARALKAELLELDGLGAEISSKRAALAAEGMRLEEGRRELARLIERKLELYAVTEAGRKRAEEEVEALVRKASDLQALLRELEEQRPLEGAWAPDSVSGTAERVPASEPVEMAGLTEAPLEHARSFAEARGTLILPVRGRLITEFNERSSTGFASQGLMIETREGALVIAPFDGRVVFAGTFRGYGQLLIIEHGEGYHTLLAGLGRIDCVLGQWLLGGEPVGVMVADSEGRPKLYVELRREGQPIDPIPWLARDDRTVSG